MAADPRALDAPRLAAVTPRTLRSWFGAGRTTPVPLEPERVRLVRELGAGLAQHFGGRAEALVRSAGGSAAVLVVLVARHFPGESIALECRVLSSFY